MSARKWTELAPRVVERALAGDRKALDAMVQHYWPVVWWAVGARVRRVPRLGLETEDLVSQVWIELLRNDLRRLRYYDPQRGTLWFFIAMQASQVAGRLIERGRNRLENRLERQPRVDADELGFDSLEPIMIDQLLLEQFCQLAREQLSESDLELIDLRWLQGFEPRELASRFQCKRKAIYQRSHRLEKKLRAMAEQLMGPRSPSPGPDSSSGEGADDPLLRLAITLLLFTLLG